MNEALTITILLSIVAGLLAALVLVLGWMGNKLYNRLGEMSTSMIAIEATFHGRVNELDRRVTRLEPHPYPIARMEPVL